MKPFTLILAAPRLVCKTVGAVVMVTLTRQGYSVKVLADQFNAKLWDGTTVIASGVFKINAAVINIGTITLGGVITSPAGNLKISVNDQTSTGGKILFNASGNSKDSWIAAVRIG